MPKRLAFTLVFLLILLIGLSACEGDSTPGGGPPLPEGTVTPSAVPSASSGCIDALQTDTLLDYGYNHPAEVVCVEGRVVRPYYASASNGKPTFLNFHDPHDGWFTALIWGDHRDNFPPDPEDYYLNKRVRVTGVIEIYKGSPEIILRQPSQLEVVDSSEEEPSDETFLVTRVVDGDTIEIEGGEIIRYIGVDAPETVHPEKPVEYFGREAAAKNRELVEGKRIRLEKDVQDKDTYGRSLRYVWLGDTMVNAELVRLGYAYSSSFPPNVAHQDLLLQAEQEARQNERGLWAPGSE
ncbi:MAG: thermonuclease family protein [Dehalococcoidia bacterium]